MNRQHRVSPFLIPRRNSSRISHCVFYRNPPPISDKVLFVISRLFYRGHPLFSSFYKDCPLLHHNRIDVLCMTPVWHPIHLCYFHIYLYTWEEIDLDTLSLDCCEVLEETSDHNLFEDCLEGLVIGSWFSFLSPWYLFLAKTSSNNKS
jgi:hypothetical protein